jgi:hypothetical protein
LFLYFNKNILSFSNIFLIFNEYLQRSCYGYSGFETIFRIVAIDDGIII